jgi:hypothetical protein
MANHDSDLNFQAPMTDRMRVIRREPHALSISILALTNANWIQFDLV